MMAARRLKTAPSASGDAASSHSGRRGSLVGRAPGDRSAGASGEIASGYRLVLLVPDVRSVTHGSEHREAKGVAFDLALNRPLSVVPVRVPDMTTRIDCDTCVVRGLACHDCVVTVLLGPPPELTFDDDECRALDVLAQGGLVPPLRLVQPVAAPEIESA